MNVEALPDGALRIEHGGSAIAIPQHYVASLIAALRHEGGAALMEAHLARHRQYAWNSATDLPPPDPEFAEALPGA